VSGLEITQFSPNRLQISVAGTISVGIVLVLLIFRWVSEWLLHRHRGGIIRQAGNTSCCAVGASILAGATIGLLQGFWFAKLHVSSFIVMLADYLDWQGVLLYVLGSTGTVNLTNPAIVGLANTILPFSLGWLLSIVFIGTMIASALLEHRQRARAGVQGPST
jgi:D-xylose transport system permease protein